ncbi:MAG: SPASM domain-containing protein [Candidatus Omnitrophica bacterium]|nr:SPASM domain-containing protein [Candidatus Omnitrophota bacterium]
MSIKENVKRLLFNNPGLISNNIVKALILAYYKRLWSERSGNVVLTDIAVENTNVCNARCEMCAYKDMKRNKKIMPLQDYARIIDIAAAENIKRLYLGQLGEPFTDKGIFDKMDYAIAKGMELVSITTNASLLDEAASRRLLGYPWKAISFSVDGATRGTYEEIRKGLEFETVENNIVSFLKVRKELGRTDLRVRMQMAVYGKNKHEVDEYRVKWKERLVSGLDEIALLYATNYAGLTGIEYSGDSAGRQVKVPCGRLWNHMITVAVNGDIPICCWDYDVDNNVGNVFREGSLKGLWNGQRMREVRKIHVDGGYGMIPLCANCNDNFFVKPHFVIEKT